MDTVRYLFALLVMMHGLVHTIGFAKSAGAGDIPQITQDISKSTGFAWLMTSILFVTIAVLYLFKQAAWSYLALLAIIISQLLIASVWEDARYGTVMNAIILIALIAGVYAFSPR